MIGLAGNLAVSGQEPITRVPADLRSDLTTDLHALASQDYKTWNFIPNAHDLGMNRSVWTWPVNLSCLGYSSGGFQAVLLSPTKILTCGHFFLGNTVTFTQTNGAAWTAVITNRVQVIGDMVVAQLSNRAPPAIVLPCVLPPDYTNYITGHNLAGIPAFWAHKNTARLEYAPIVSCADNNFLGFGTWLRIGHDGYGHFGKGSSATGGDSGSTAFAVWKNQPVLLFATTLRGDAAGLFISGATNWNALAHAVGTNDLRIISMHEYRRQ